MGKESFLAFIDYKKAFDSVDRNLLLYKLSKIGICGKMYKAISSLYASPKSRVVLNNDIETEYFECPMGVKQGDCLSPTLFAIFINDLATEIKNSGLGIDLNIEGGPNIEQMISILLYADDIVCLADNENDLQGILFIVECWCKRWRLEVNLSKTNILHVRCKRKQQSKFVFLFDRKPVPYCKNYKYLGVNIDEFLNFNFTVEKHAEAAGRALAVVLTKMIKNGGFPYNLFSLLYHSCVTSISDYSGPITGFSEYESLMKVHLRAIRAFLGLTKNACTAGVLSEVDFELPKYRTNIQMVRHYNRILSMEDHRLTKKIYLWDRALNERNIVSTWSNEIKDIFIQCNLEAIFNSNTKFNQQYVIDKMKACFKESQIAYLTDECSQKPKLRTFVTFKNFEEQASYITKPLMFYHRRNLARIRLGCLPLRIETGRYSIPRMPETERTCLVCKIPAAELEDAGDSSTPIESEIHFLFECKAYSAERGIWYQKMNLPNNFSDLPSEEKLRLTLNHACNVKFTAQFITAALNARSKIMK